MNNEGWERLGILIAMALSGAAALIYEVVASQALLYFFSSNTYSVATVLSAFLFGLALGSLVMSKLLPRIKNKRAVFVVIEFLIGAYALLFLIKFETLPVYLINSNISGFALVLAKFAVSFTYLLIPTLLLGALFPLASSLLIKKVEKAGSDVGLLYSFDTFGAIAGAFAAGFFLIPVIGLTQSILVGVMLSMSAGFLIIGKELKKILVYAAGFILVLFLAFATSNGEEKAFIEDDEIKYVANKKIVFEENTAYGIVNVAEYDGEYWLYINKRYMCGEDYDGGREIVDVALTPDTRDVLVIGLGCGVSLRKILEFENVKNVDVVEINPLVPILARKYFSTINNNALNDERVNLIIDDGVHYLLTTDKKYDAIIIDLENPIVAHSSPLYTVEYFKIISKLLNGNGVFSLQGYEGDFKYKKLLYFSLKEAFSHVYLKKGFNYVASNQQLSLNLTDTDLETLDRLSRETSYQLNTLDHQILSRYVDT